MLISASWRCPGASRSWGHILPLSLLLICSWISPSLSANDELVPSANDELAVLKQENLVAWCIVPFDAAKRGPAERAEMLRKLGIKRCAYDWRQQHVPSFEEEIQEYQKNGIEFFAFWGEHDTAFELFEKYNLKPQIWQMLGDPGDVPDKVNAAAESLSPLAKRCKRLGCKLGIYNHGGWSGEPKNMVAICKLLQAKGFDNVGIVYNFHHGHEHIQNWERSFKLMQPMLICLNLNGMNDKAQPKILGIGKGQHELQMIRLAIAQGYDGPIGILDHRNDLDAAESLKENMAGLAWVRDELKQPGSGGEKPITPKPLK